MKKDYVSYLRQYDAKTANFDKLDKYRRKFIQTCFDRNQENHVAKRSQDISPRQKHTKSRLLTQGTAKQRITSDSCQSRQTSFNWPKNYKQINIDIINDEPEGRPKAEVLPGKCNKSNQHIAKQQAAQHTEFELRCIKMGTILVERQAMQIEACRDYYLMLRNQLKTQQSLTLQYINSHFAAEKLKLQQAAESIAQKMRMEARLPYNYSKPQCVSTEVEIQLLSIVITPEAMLKIKQKIKQFSLLAVSCQHPCSPTPNFDKNGKQSTEPKSQSSASQSSNLYCSQLEFGTDANTRMTNQPNISFEGDYQGQKRSCPLVLEQQQESTFGVSPSFKLI